MLAQEVPEWLIVLVTGFTPAEYSSLIRAATTKC